MVSSRPLCLKCLVEELDEASLLIRSLSPERRYEAPGWQEASRAIKVGGSLNGLIAHSLVQLCKNLHRQPSVSIIRPTESARQRLIDFGHHSSLIGPS